MQPQSIRVTITCARCDQTFRAYPSEKRRYCSQACYHYGNSVEARFWKFVQKSDGCWLWVGKKAGNGYGSFPHVGGKGGPTWRAHRFSWVLHYGFIPEALMVCHHCDTPACIRPDHLFLGTQAENIRDKISKGRGPKLKADSIRIIRAASGITMPKLAAQFGVSTSTVRAIRSGKSWHHLT